MSGLLRRLSFPRNGRGDGHPGQPHDDQQDHAGDAHQRGARNAYVNTHENLQWLWR